MHHLKQLAIIFLLLRIPSASMTTNQHGSGANNVDACSRSTLDHYTWVRDLFRIEFCRHRDRVTRHQLHDKRRNVYRCFRRHIVKRRVASFLVAL